MDLPPKNAIFGSEFATIAIHGPITNLLSCSVICCNTTLEYTLLVVYLHRFPVVRQHCQPCGLWTSSPNQPQIASHRLHPIFHGAYCSQCRYLAGDDERCGSKPIQLLLLPSRVSISDLKFTAFFKTVSEILSYPRSRKYSRGAQRGPRLVYSWGPGDIQSFAGGGSSCNL
jgi:hypothetical protein